MTCVMTHLPYGEVWKKQRRAVSLFMRKSVIGGCYPLQEAAAKQFLSSLLKEPQSYHENLRL
jgi:hypothetical protein